MEKELRDQKIIELYKKNNPMNKIAEILNISSGTVNKVLKVNNIKIRRKHSKIKEDYFENSNCEKSAYWAGFIAADGYIYNPNKGNSQSSLTIELSNNDKVHLCKLGDDLGKNITNYNKHNSCKLRITSNKICKDLERYNIHQNKSLTLQFPKNIDLENIHHFIRGYFDGDGSFTKIYDIIGTEIFLKSLVNILPFDCEHSFYKPKDQNCYYLRIKTKSLKQFFEFMYNDATIYLDRKYQKQLAFYNKEISSKQTI